MELPTLWQDWIFALGQIFALIALLPTLFGSDKPSKYSSAPTAVILYVFSYTYYSLDLLWGAAMSFLVALIWTILFFQKIY